MIDSKDFAAARPVSGSTCCGFPTAVSGRVAKGIDLGQKHSGGSFAATLAASAVHIQSDLCPSLRVPLRGKLHFAIGQSALDRHSLSDGLPEAFSEHMCRPATNNCVKAVKNAATCSVAMSRIAKCALSDLILRSCKCRASV